MQSQGSWDVCVEDLFNACLFDNTPEIPPCLYAEKIQPSQGPLFQLATGRAGTKGVKESPCCAKRHKRRRWSECLLNNSQVIRVCKNPQPQQQKLPRFTNNQSLSCKRARNSRGPACHSSSNPCKEGPQKLNVHGSKERSRHRCASGHSGSDFR